MHRVAQAFVVALTLSVAFAGWSDNLIDDPIDFGDFFVTSTTENLDGQPDFTHSYHVTGKILIPYAEIEEPFEAWYDVSNANNTQSRVDYYDGVMATYQLQHPAEFGVMRKVIWTTVGSVDQPTRGCFEVNGTKEGPVSAQSVIPDVSVFKKVEGSKTQIRGQECELWQNVTELYGRTNTYNLWLARRNTNARPYYPVRYEMKGFNSLLGSHYDHYIIDYDVFEAATPDKDVFDVPSNLTCTGFPGPGQRGERASFNPIGEFISGVDHRYQSEFEDFKRTHDRTYHPGEVEHERRMSHFRHNMRFIESFNRRNAGFTLAPNHMTDYTPDEFKLMRGRRPTKGYNGGLPHKYTERDLKDVPSFWDWRYVGAVTPVKDQSICGSCWTFGTTGHLEGAYFLKTGKLVKMSQQALIDCSWQFDNNGCDGGEDFRAYEWMMKEGGIPTADSYGPYMGADGKCHVSDPKVQKVGKIYGYVNVTSGNQDALKLAIFRQGPISVAIDASPRTFSFYSNGVYYDPKCSSTELDHAVLAVGYGELYGQPYWLVKNSWSTYWGNDGYILMAMKDNNCGVATEPTFVIM
jgi:C1A family cysteine protease